ncbi:Membrane-associated lipoprotein precursor, partial [Mycoplasma putrefaciens]
MKLLNKLLLISSTSTIVLPSLLVVACNRVTENSISNLSIEQVDDFINSIKSEDDLKKVAEFEFEVVFGRKKSLSETLPTEIEASASSLKIKLREKKYKDNVTISVESARTNRTATANTSNIEGKVTLFISILNRKNNKSQARQLVLSGLSRNAGFDHNSRQEVDPLAAFGGPEGVKKYSENNQKQRFKSDNDTYIKRLESMYNPDGADKAVDIKQRFGLDISQDDQAKFDKLAEEVNFDSYYNAALKGFTLPVYENDNSKMVKKLRINDNPEVNKGPSFTDSLGTDHSKSNGLARTLINETYKTIAEQTFQVKFTYVKDFANEIGLLEKHKALISSW